MQIFFSIAPYPDDMAKTASRLKAFREAAGLSQRELARQVGQDQSNIRYWEQSGNPPRSDVLVPMASAIGVTVEELLGQPKPRRVVAPGGRLNQAFQRVAKLPRRQQQKIAEVVEALVSRHADENAA